MAIIASNNGEWGYLFEDKICQKCHNIIETLELPNPPETLQAKYEDIFIIKENNKYLEVCDKCYKKSKKYDEISVLINSKESYE